jgi:carbon monoxide dehydrogenase subunit G
MKIEQSIIINRNAKEVFDFVKDVSNHKKFGTAFQDARKLTEGELREGSEVMRKVNFMGKSIEAHQQVKTFNQDHQITFETIEGPVPVEDSFIVEQIGDNETRFTLSIEAKLSGMMKFGASMMKGQIESQIQNDLNNLKNLLESSAN